MGNKDTLDRVAKEGLSKEMIFEAGSTYERELITWKTGWREDIRGGGSFMAKGTKQGSILKTEVMSVGLVSGTEHKKVP